MKPVGIVFDYGPNCRKPEREHSAGKKRRGRKNPNARFSSGATVHPPTCWRSPWKNRRAGGKKGKKEEKKVFEKINNYDPCHIAVVFRRGNVEMRGQRQGPPLGPSSSWRCRVAGVIHRGAGKKKKEERKKRHGHGSPNELSTPRVIGEEKKGQGWPHLQILKRPCAVVRQYIWGPTAPVQPVPPFFCQIPWLVAGGRGKKGRERAARPSWFPRTHLQGPLRIRANIKRGKGEKGEGEWKEGLVAAIKFCSSRVETS